MSSPPPPSKDLLQLFYISLNDDKPATILLLHGLMSSHREWTRIASSLSEYHLLVPDLPGHRSSDHLGPFTLSHASELVANLIRAHGHNSSCHAVGFSGGGFVAVEIANRYPELVQSLLVSGVVSIFSSNSKDIMTASRALSSTPSKDAVFWSFHQTGSGSNFDSVWRLLTSVFFSMI